MKSGNAIGVTTLIRRGGRSVTGATGLNGQPSSEIEVRTMRIAGGFRRMIILTRTKDQAEGEIKRIYSLYPFQGYGTKIIREPEMNEDGVWRAEVERYEHCD